MLLWGMLLLMGWMGWIAAQDGNGKEPSGENTEPKSETNLWFYVHEENDENDSFTRVFPLYSYRRKSSQLQDEFSFWPFFSSYESAKNPIPSTLPHSGSFQWNTFAFLSLGSSRIDPAQVKETSTMVSFLFLTYSQETYVKDEYLSRSWYSLPGLSYYHSESLTKEGITISNTEFGNPLFSLNDIRIQDKDNYYPVYYWAFSPASLVLGEDSFKIISQGRWGRDQQMEILSWDAFALFSVSTTFSQYPGAEYHRFAEFEMNLGKGAENLFNPKLSSPTTRLGILSPFLLWESNPSGAFSCQLLPLFYYHSHGKQSSLKLLPLGLEIGSEGVRFAPDFTKFFPLVYHDSGYGRWDILWPVFYYQENPVIPGYHMKFRFILDYRSVQNSQGDFLKHITLLEGFLLSYHAQSGRRQLEILPGGLLFGYYEYETEFQWRVLGFGYEENPERDSLQLFFIRIPIHYKGLSEK